MRASGPPFALIASTDHRRQKNPIEEETYAYIVGVMVVARGRAAAQPFFPLRPPLEVRMSGVLQPFEEKGSHALNTLTVTMNDQKRLFKVNRVDTVTGSDPGMMLLNDIFPPQLRIIGAPDLLVSLEQAQVSGKTVMLQGFLYIQDRNFYVGEARVAKLHLNNVPHKQLTNNDKKIERRKKA